MIFDLTVIKSDSATSDLGQTRIILSKCYREVQQNHVLSRSVYTCNEYQAEVRGRTFPVGLYSKYIRVLQCPYSPYIRQSKIPNPETATRRRDTGRRTTGTVAHGRSPLVPSGGFIVVVALINCSACCLFDRFYFFEGCSRLYVTDAVFNFLLFSVAWIPSSIQAHRPCHSYPECG